MKLNVGCGRDRKKGYVGIDITRGRVVDKVAPAWNLPYENDSVEEVFSSHMIEHLSPTEFEQALEEWKRVLELGGRLVLRCPNFQLYVRMWLEGDYEYRWGDGICNLYGQQDKGPSMLTRTGFTCKRLRELVKGAGFKNVQCRVITNRSGNMPGGDVICVATK